MGFSLLASVSERAGYLWANQRGLLLLSQGTAAVLWGQLQLQLQLVISLHLLQ